jgi:potassium efflux system protein
MLCWRKSVQNKWFLAGWAFLLGLFLWVAQSSGAPPQTLSNPATAPQEQRRSEAATPAPEAIQQKIAELDQKIKVARETENEQTAQQLGVDLALLQERTQLLKEIQETYGWWLGNLEREAVLKKEKTAAAEKMATLKERGVTEPPPYSLTFYKDLLSQLQSFDQRQEGYTLSSSLFSEHLNLLREKRGDAGKKGRLLQDKLAAVTTPDEKKKLTFQLEIARLSKELADTEYLAAQTYGNNFKLLQEMASQQAEVYRQQAAWVQKNLSIQDRDQEQQLTLLGQKQKKIAGKVAEIQRVMQQKTKMWDKVNKEAGVAKASGPLQEEISQERQDWQHTQHLILDCLLDHLNILRFEEATWKNRLALLRGEATQEQLVRWQQDLEKKKEVGKKFFQYLGDQNISLQSQLAALEKRLAKPDLDPRLKDILNSQKAAYALLIQEQNSLLQTVADAAQLVQRFSHEIKDHLIQDPWSALTARLKVALKHFLDYEIWVIDKQAVTVSKFLEALVFLILGLLLARIILHHLLYPLLERTLWRHVKAEILQKTVRYLAYTVVVLITLGKLRIPLQSFATLGGGIAIGLGFAAQTIIKNFISGFILLGEKPIDIGDLVEVGGIVGNVQDIGSRSTLVKTGENKDILVPNSYFLENTITNWTRKDRRIRAQVTVGVAYGSQVDKVKELLLQAAAEHDQILKTPQPFVLFNDFGDSSLVFDLYIWIEVAGVMGRRIIQSALRFKIDQLFRAAGLVIAFPQRDVHLDTQGPLEVHLVDKGQE